jgi:hypothetical protein
MRYVLLSLCCVLFVAADASAQVCRGPTCRLPAFRVEMRRPTVVVEVPATVAVVAAPAAAPVESRERPQVFNGRFRDMIHNLFNRRR